MKSQLELLTNQVEDLKEQLKNKTADLYGDVLSDLRRSAYVLTKIGYYLRENGSHDTDLDCLKASKEVLDIVKKLQATPRFSSKNQ